jgi:hypothetical protein
MLKRSSTFLEEPHGNSYVWRYMSAEKFERLLVEQSLYFCNAKRLSDKYEVTIPDSTVASWRKELRAQGYDGADVEIEVQIRLASWQNGGMRDLTLINCWAMRRDESYALWKIYLDGNPDGVALRTRYATLNRAISLGRDAFAEDYFGGLVRYRNHLSPEDAKVRFNIVTTKKTFYDFEHEVRLFILNYQGSEGGYETPYDITQGRLVRVDLPVLVTDVYVSPFASPNFRKELPRLLKRHGLASAHVRESEILET